MPFVRVRIKSCSSLFVCVLDSFGAQNSWYLKSACVQFCLPPQAVSCCVVRLFRWVCKIKSQPKPSLTQPEKHVSIFRLDINFFAGTCGYNVFAYVRARYTWYVLDRQGSFHVRAFLTSNIYICTRPRWLGRSSSCQLKSISPVQFSLSAHTRWDFLLA